MALGARGAAGVPRVPIRARVQGGAPLAELRRAHGQPHGEARRPPQDRRRLDGGRAHLRPPGRQEGVRLGSRRGEGAVARPPCRHPCYTQLWGPRIHITRAARAARPAARAREQSRAGCQTGVTTGAWSASPLRQGEGAPRRPGSASHSPHREGRATGHPAITCRDATAWVAPVHPPGARPGHVGARAALTRAAHAPSAPR